MQCFLNQTFGIVLVPQNGWFRRPPNILDHEDLYCLPFLSACRGLQKTKTLMAQGDSSCMSIQFHLTRVGCSKIEGPR